MISKTISKAISVIIATSAFFVSSSLYSEKVKASDLEKDIPEWMETQIITDLSSIQAFPISLRELDEFFRKNSADLLLVKFTISDNKVYNEFLFPSSEGNLYRMSHFVKALKLLCNLKKMPDMTFLLSLHDGLGSVQPVPVFTMAKRCDMNNFILLPDYDALQGEYQVLKNQNVVTSNFPWKQKKSKLIWRGSTAQRALDGETYWLTTDNCHIFSRVLLCELSQKYPELINAKFTFFAQGGEQVPYLKQFKGNWLSFEHQYQYKYQILIDGNVCAYSNSCWKCFTNSLIFKPDSLWIQWYYNAFSPYVHFVPIKSNLDDLVEKMRWAMDNDSIAEQIASNMRNFAVNNLTSNHSHVYLYHVLQRYADLPFVYE